MEWNLRKCKLRQINKLFYNFPKEGTDVARIPQPLVNAITVKSTG